MEQSLAAVIRGQAERNGGRPAITFEGTTITYAELDSSASRVGNALTDEGVTAGDRVAWLGKNLPEYFETLFGASKVGAVAVALNWRLAPPEIAQVLEDSRAAVLVLDAEFLPAVVSVRSQLTHVEQIVLVGESDDSELERFAEWRDSRSDTDPGHEPAPDDVAMQYYTSGTTGLPKGAMLSASGLLEGLPWIWEQWEVDANSTFLVMMPLFHVSGSGWALVGLATGAHCVMLRDVDLDAVLRIIPEYRVSHVVFVPAVIQFLLSHPAIAGTDLSSLRVVVYGASPISREVLGGAVARFGCEFFQMYGLTETSGGITMLPAKDHDPESPHPERLQSAGLPMSGTDLRIVDPATGDESPTGTVGEVWIRSRQNMLGYWNMPQATAEALDGENWFRSGDAGYLDDDGYLYIHDRVKDMVITGGENVYPAEVEAALIEHPSVADVGVIGVPDSRWGEAVKAVVVPAPDTTLDEDALIVWAKERLAGYKCPSSVDVADELPRNPTGKILKKDLREPYWRGRERRVS